MAPKLHCRQKLLVIHRYSKHFEWIREVIRTQRKGIKSYKNFEQDFLVEQNLTLLKGDSQSGLNCLYEIVVVWGDQTTVNMGPCYLYFVVVYS